MKVFLTGATGYISSVIAEKLLQVQKATEHQASSAFLSKRNLKP
jgi:thioester reductase-like protein